MKTPTIISDGLRTEILALAIPKTHRCRHKALEERTQSRRYGCGQKRQYTFEYAQEVVTRFRRNHNQLMNAYRCRHCQHWHVGRATDIKNVSRKSFTQSQRRERPTIEEPVDIQMCDSVCLAPTPAVFSYHATGRIRLPHAGRFREDGDSHQRG